MSTQLSQGRIYVSQGEFAVGSQPADILSTILGSCVSACMWDPVARVGGLNHILLANARGPGAVFEGVNAMEVLINGLIRVGAERSRLEAKVIGGARMVAGLSDIGQKNADFVLGFLRDEKIPVRATDVGGTKARQIRLYPVTARIQVKYVDRTGINEAVNTAPRKPKPTGDVELF